MSYAIDTTSGAVIRTSDGAQIAPTQSTTDPAYLEYLQWVEAGNQPTYIYIPQEDVHKK